MWLCLNVYSNACYCVHTIITSIAYIVQYTRCLFWYIDHIVGHSAAWETRSTSLPHDVSECCHISNCYAVIYKKNNKITALRKHNMQIVWETYWLIGHCARTNWFQFVVVVLLSTSVTYCWIKMIITCAYWCKGCCSNS